MSFGKLSTSSIPTLHYGFFLPRGFFLNFVKTHLTKSLSLSESETQRLRLSERVNGEALGFVLFVFNCVTVLASSQHNTAEDETVDNQDERLPPTTSRSDCLIPLIRVDFSTLE